VFTAVPAIALVVVFRRWLSLNFSVQGNVLCVCVVVFLDILRDAGS